MTRINKICPICENKLKSQGRRYRIKEIFDLWRPIKFEPELIKKYLQISPYTQLFYCPNCDLEIYLPQLIGAPDFYEELHQKTGEQYYVGWKWDFEEALKDIKKDNSVLEIGCGPGHFLQMAKKITKDIFGTEYNAMAKNLAKQKGINIIEPKDFKNLKGKFDSVFCFHVLEHVAEPLEFIKELASWVVPGGKIGISVPNQDGPVKYVDRCVSNMPPHHATHWRLKTFKVVAEKLGLKIKNIVFEPLISRDIYYYSFHMINSKISNRYIKPFLSGFIQKSLEKTFQILAKFNIKSIKIIKGQSIYILMEKQKD